MSGGIGAWIMSDAAIGNETILTVAPGWRVTVTGLSRIDGGGEVSDAVTLTQQGMVAAFYAAKLGRLPKKGEAEDCLAEELGELLDVISYRRFAPAAAIKELADVLYTCYSYALARGWDLERAFQLVHESNMTKEPTTKGKVQKGENYVAPDLSECIGG